MDLDDDELRATREGIYGVTESEPREEPEAEVEEENDKEYKIYCINNSGKYYAQAIVVGGTPAITMTPTISRNFSACFIRETAEKYVELLKECNEDESVTYGFEEV